MAQFSTEDYLSMPNILYARSGDSQSLKVCIAASFSGTPLELKKIAHVKEVPLLPGASGKTLLVTSNGCNITDPNAMAELIGKWEINYQA